MKTVAIILGAGNSTRMKSEKSKMLLDLCGKTVIERSVEKFSSLSQVDKIVVVCRQSDLDDFSQLIKDKKVKFVIGGETRQQSVINAVHTISECDLLIIHDGARPLVLQSTIINTIEKAKETGAAATGVFVKDTIKVVDDKNIIKSTPNRANLVAIQTPQIFDFDLYSFAIKKSAQENKDFTDDCQLVENVGKEVSVVVGDYSNIKITTADDIPVAEGLLKQGRQL